MSFITVAHLEFNGSWDPWPQIFISWPQIFIFQNPLFVAFGVRVSKTVTLGVRPVAQKMAPCFHFLAPNFHSWPQFFISLAPDFHFSKRFVCVTFGAFGPRFSFLGPIFSFPWPQIFILGPKLSFLGHRFSFIGPKFSLLALDFL